MRTLLLWTIVIALAPVAAHAQEEPRPVLWDIARSVLSDPTTYAPATLAYTAHRLDWKSSQVFFAHGWVESNSTFTVSGRPNDVPVSYQRGVRLIGVDALGMLGVSGVNNLAAGIGERILITRYPTRRTFWHTLGWIERISVASYVSYVSSASHLRQIGINRRMAQKYGYR